MPGLMRRCFLPPNGSATITSVPWPKRCDCLYPENPAFVRNLFMRFGPDMSREQGREQFSNMYVKKGRWDIIGCVRNLAPNAGQNWRIWSAGERCFPVARPGNAPEKSGNGESVWQRSRPWFAPPYWSGAANRPKSACWNGCLRRRTCRYRGIWTELPGTERQKLWQ